jgi:TatD DNase family protein
VNSTTEAEWQEVLTLAHACPEVTPFIGIHPWWAAEVSAGWQVRLAAILAATRAGIGEIGLDALAAAADQCQEELFVRQLLLAEELALPVAIHCCRRWGRLLELLTATLGGRARVIIHGFGGSLETMYRLLDLGAMLSFGPALAHPAREKVREAFRRAPTDRVLLESDWAPRQQTSQRRARANEIPDPAATLTALYRLAAGLKSMSEPQLRTLVWNNGQLLISPLSSSTK